MGGKNAKGNSSNNNGVTGGGGGCTRLGWSFPPPPKWWCDGNKGGRQVKAKAMMTAMAMATRVTSNVEGNDNSDEGGKQ